MENIKVGLMEKILIKIKSFLKKDLKMKMLVAYLIINLLYLLIGSYIYYTEKLIAGFHYKEFSIGLKYLFIVNVIVFIAIIVKKWKNKDLKSLTKPIYIGITLAIIFAIISAIFAYDTKIALEGCYGRYEGLFSILYYLTLMLLTTFVSNKYKKILVNTILVCGLVQAIYGIFQVFGLFNVKQYFHIDSVYFDNTTYKDVFVKQLWVLGFTNSPNFLGAYMLLCLSYSFGLFIDSKKKSKNIIYVLLSILFMFVLLITNTSAVIVGLLAVLIYIFIYCLKNKYYEKFLTIFIIIVSITCLTVALDKTTLVKDMLKIGKETNEISKGNLEDNYGTKRVYIWKETMKIVSKYLVHGVGVDSFHKAFDGEALTFTKKGKTVLFDKAHNEYLQTLVTQGIFSLASYLFIYGYVIYKGNKNAFKNKQIYLVLPIIGYLVQAFFNISVIEVAPMFYIALGLCCEQTNSIIKENGEEKNEN